MSFPSFNLQSGPAIQKVSDDDSDFNDNNSIVRQILDALPYVGLIVNEQRRVVYSNDAIFKLNDLAGIERLLGLKPGELLNCVNNKLVPEGCGASDNCRLCNISGILGESMQTGLRVEADCRFTSFGEKLNNSWDFHCVAAPIVMNGRPYTILTMVDISHEKRRRALEKIFFHDIINTASGLNGIIDFINDMNQQDDLKEYVSIVNRLSKILIDEILAQRELSNAENDELVVKKETIFSLDLITDVANYLIHHKVAEERRIILDSRSDNIRFISDSTLLKRVLLNMLKNALEAIEPGRVVIIGCYNKKDLITFWVHNPGVIDMDIQKQIFQRSFSTKDADRGLGTYSMRLIGEKYLNGKVWFSSTPAAGTLFNISLKADL